MIDNDTVIKSLAISIAIILGTRYLLTETGIVIQDLIKLFLVAFTISYLIEYLWPNGFFYEFKEVTSDKPVEIINLPTFKSTNYLVKLQNAFTHYGALNKFYLNSFLDNHADKHIVQSIIQEHIKEIGEIIAEKVSISKAKHLAKMLASKQDAFEEAMASTLSENPNRIKEALKNLHLVGNELADAYHKLNPSKLPLDDMEKNVKKCIDQEVSMVFARLEQNWQRDVKIYYQFQDSLSRISTKLASSL